MKYLFAVFLAVVGNVSFAQNDSLMPNFTATYQVNCNADWSSSENFTFINPNLEFDTVEVFNSSSEMIARLYMDSLQVWIKRIIEIPDCYVGWSQEITNGWELLYDFGLSVGDSAYSIYAGQGIITSIEEIEIQGETRKKFIIDDGYDTYIQGIGSVRHPFMPKMYIFEVSYEVCTSNLYYFGPSSIDSLTFSVNCDGQILSSQNRKLPEFNLYPNPSTSYTILSTEENQTGTVKIRNLAGQLLETHQMYHQSIRLDTSTFSKGVYFVILESSGYTAVEKLMVH